VNIVITGGAGFLGRRLAERLLRRGTLAGADNGQQTIGTLTLFDAVPPSPPLIPDRRLRLIAGDIADRDAVRAAIGAGTSTVFHFAAVVSAEAEADTDKGLRVNLDGTRAVLEACRALGTAPRVLFASSLAVYGGALPPAVTDDTPLRPQTSYGAAKAMGELLVNDWSRKGYIDGRVLRFPTIVIRPGRPNRAASTWASSIFREPLAGQETVCPVSRDTVMAILSPRRALAAIEQVHDLPAARLGDDRSLLLPSISVTVAEMLAALERAGGAACLARIGWRPDPTVQKIVDGWPRALDAARARALGIAPDPDLDAIVAAFVEDDLGAPRDLVRAGA
jgi:nucleoside-diphosphate-sugar epimerase